MKIASVMTTDSSGGAECAAMVVNAAHAHAERTYAAPVVAQLIEGLLDEALVSAGSRARALA